MSLGQNASLGGARLFPADNAWNQDISGADLDPLSATFINGIGKNTAFHPDFGDIVAGVDLAGIPYVVVDHTTAEVPISFAPGGVPDESDPGPMPIPKDAPVEGGLLSIGDRHVLVIDKDACRLYELDQAYPQLSGSWQAYSSAIFDLTSDTLRPAGYTSADAAGLPILPGLVRYDEVIVQKEIRHALRFTVTTTQRGYVAPARHYASTQKNVNLPPMGMRVRLKASFDISKYPADAQVILTALKKYGMILADNGSNWYVSGAPDPRWNAANLNTLKQVKGSDFEVVKMGAVTRDWTPAK